ncbi:hypothetical protein PG993_007375 [Apiospora rasikravindrae]|uniref:Secreted protein n=1 Tax=Apiospora rasikravindrae TaxID=990691 RepID=A0ABR1SXB5_9PEZI
MIRSLAVSVLYPAALVPLLFQHYAAAELLGCDAVGCPTNEYHVAQCKIGNATLQALGITNVTTTLDTRPLTWTVGFQEAPKDSISGHPEAAMALDKNFYLGTPPSMRFDNSTAGCALFFEGISANITVPQDKKNSFTCADALSEDCVSDLVRQAESAAKFAGNADACSQLRDSLTNKPPPSCNSVKGGTWGSVISRPLTGGNQSLEMVDQSQCRATTGQGYDLFLVDSERHYLTDRTTKALSQVILGITPVMTVLEKDGKAKAELTCLRLVDSVANQTDDEPHPSMGSPNGSLSSTMYLATLLVSAFLYVL